MVAPVLTVSSSGWAWTNRTRRSGRSVVLTRATLRGDACDDRGVEYPELAARTKLFRAGAPRAVTVGADGARVVFLRSGGAEDPVDQLWVLDVAKGTERLVCDPNRIATADGEDLPDAER